MSGRLVNCQAAAVGNANAAAGSGINEVEFSVVAGALGVPSISSGRPDLVGTTVSNPGAGQYTVTLAEALPDQFAIVSIVLARAAAGTSRAVQFDTTSTSSSLKFFVTDNAGAAASMASGEAFHVVARWRRDGEQV